MKGIVKREILRKPTKQWHCPARFPRAKFRNDPAIDCTQIALVGGEQANRSAIMAYSGFNGQGGRLPSRRSGLDHRWVHLRFFAGGSRAGRCRSPTRVSSECSPPKRGYFFQCRSILGSHFTSCLAELYSLAYKYADINCALVVCCHVEGDDWAGVLQEVSNNRGGFGIGLRKSQWYRGLCRRGGGGGGNDTCGSRNSSGPRCQSAMVHRGLRVPVGDRGSTPQPAASKLSSPPPPSFHPRPSPSRVLPTRGARGIFTLFVAPTMLTRAPPCDVGGVEMMARRKGCCGVRVWGWKVDPVVAMSTALRSALPCYLSARPRSLWRARNCPRRSTCTKMDHGSRGPTFRSRAPVVIKAVHDKKIRSAFSWTVDGRLRSSTERTRGMFEVRMFTNALKSLGHIWNFGSTSAGSPDFRKWESCRTMSLVSGFSRGPPVSPAPSFRRRYIFTSVTLISSQDLAPLALTWKVRHTQSLVEKNEVSNPEHSSDVSRHPIREVGERHRNDNSYRQFSHGDEHFDRRRKLHRRIGTGDIQLVMMRAATPWPLRSKASPRCADDQKDSINENEYEDSDSAEYDAEFLNISTHFPNEFPSTSGVKKAERDWDCSKDWHGLLWIVKDCRGLKWIADENCEGLVWIGENRCVD
ncbi:hypothetical protein PR048_023879 [Dryococelus australis]|uniref:Uncharacterized protein n=1 Tax=Dryococelus australis TaxID=614101 RepID=A0ABQ9GV93_9NEOP|nr:hypothetical protein PR048_023879 [Dryococelus australis]